MPLYCASYCARRYTHAAEAAEHAKSWGARFHAGFNARFERMLDLYDRWVQKSLDRPKEVVLGFLGLFVLSFLLYPLVGISFFPAHRCGTIRHQRQGSHRNAPGVDRDYVKKVEDIVRQVVPAADLNTVVSNIGLMSDLSALFTPNSGMHTAFIQVGLKEDHSVSSFTYMDEVRKRVSPPSCPQLRTYFQSGGLVDSVLNQGMPAPIDVQVSGTDLKAADESL